MKKIRKILAAILVLSFLAGMCSVALAESDCKFSDSSEGNLAADTTKTVSFTLATKAKSLKVQVGIGVTGEQPDLDSKRVKVEIIGPDGKRIGTQKELKMGQTTSDTWESTNVDAGTVKVNIVTAAEAGSMTYYVKISGEYKITLNKSTAAMKKGTSLTLTSSYAGGETKTWTSSNTKVATVDKDGVVKGVAGGTATITLKAGSQTVTCSLYVYQMAALSETPLTNKSYQLKALGTNSKDTVTWSSSNTTLAKVDSKGVMKALKAGTVTITMKVKSHVDGVTYTGTRTFTIKKNPYPKTMKVTGTKVALRAKPSTKGAIITRIATGKTVTVTAISNGWATVKYGTKTGYMMTKYLK